MPSTPEELRCLTQTFANPARTLAEAVDTLLRLADRAQHDTLAPDQVEQVNSVCDVIAKATAEANALSPPPSMSFVRWRIGVESASRMVRLYAGQARAELAMFVPVIGFGSQAVGVVEELQALAAAYEQAEAEKDLPEWVDHLTSLHRRIVRALWGKSETPRKSVWLEAWGSEQEWNSGTFASEQTRLNKALSDLFTEKKAPSLFRVRATRSKGNIELRVE